MKYKNTILKLKASLLMTATFALAATPSFAVDLMAVAGTWTSSTGTAVPMWGFAADAGSCPATPIVWGVGPELTELDLVGGNLTINLRNCLSEPVSIVISGQDAVYSPPVRNADGRIRAFTKEALANGGMATYTWNGVSSNPGTYLYMSGSHPAKQVHMGLYGSLKVGQYPGTSADVTLLYSEIDPVLHSSATVATPLTYKPRYYLVNGVEEVTIAAGDTSQPTVLSFLNAGLDFHVPALNKGYMSLKAEDGNPYPFAKEQYSANIGPGKTIEAFWQPTTTGEHVIYDRRGNGMVARLTVGGGGGGPVGPAVADDLYSVDEDNPLAVAAPVGVSINDDAGFSVELVSGTSAGAISCPAGGFLCADGSFNYQPNADFSGSDSFTYRTVATATVPSSSVATVTITVNPINDMPTAADDAYDAVTGVPLNVAAPGLLANDVDIDGDILTVTASTLPLPGVNPDGSFTIAAPVTGSYTYTVCDGAPLCTTANVTITANGDVPVAVDDFTTVRRNSTPDGTADPDDAIRNTFSVVANDTDANGIDATSVFIIGQDATGTAITSQGGTVVNNGDGTVSYTPLPIWAGTDTFAYTVQDTIGEFSNQATVRINVVRNRDLPPLP